MSLFLQLELDYVSAFLPWPSPCPNLVAGWMIQMISVIGHWSLIQSYIIHHPHCPLVKFKKQNKGGYFHPLEKMLRKSRGPGKSQQELIGAGVHCTSVLDTLQYCPLYSLNNPGMWNFEVMDVYWSIVSIQMKSDICYSLIQVYKTFAHKTVSVHCTCCPV